VGRPPWLSHELCTTHVLLQARTNGLTDTHKNLLAVGLHTPGVCGCLAGGETEDPAAPRHAPRAADTRLVPGL
jgi:hypothetical protein